MPFLVSPLFTQPHQPTARIFKILMLAQYGESTQQRNIFPRPASDFFAQKGPSMCRTTYLQGNHSENNPGSCAKTLNEIFQNSTANIANNFHNTTSPFPSSACQQIADDA